MAVLACAPPAAAQVRVDERVDVARVLVDVRVTDAHGRPILGLGTGDFEVALEGRPARIEWAEWVGEGARPGTDASSTEPAQTAALTERGRLLVFFFQKDFSTNRIEGTLRMMREATRFVARLGPDDRAAVVVFDSRLRLLADFTGDRKRLQTLLSTGILSAAQPEIPVDAEGLRWNEEAARRAASPEQALEVLAQALAPIPRAKSLVLFGFGFGDFRAPTVDLQHSYAALDDRYQAARTAMIRARVTVFALDVTQADFHTLETGLMTVADDTGGFYSRTHDFPATAMSRLERALEGHYVLAVERPARTGTIGRRHEISVSTRARGARVHARRYYID